MALSKKHGLLTPNEVFFIEIPNFWAWADNLDRYILRQLGVFSADLSALILVLSMFSVNQLVQKTKHLYPSTKYSFGIWIWIWAAKNRVSVFCGKNVSFKKAPTSNETKKNHHASTYNCFRTISLIDKLIYKRINF